jgi:putative ABC transport system permease protein
MLGLLQTSFVDGLLFALVGLALLVSFGWLRFPDLTPDGSFVFGGAIYATAVASGVPPIGSMTLALAAGCAAGFVTAVLASALRIPPVISGMITVTGLYSISWLAMGKPTTFLDSNSVLWGDGSELAIVVVTAILFFLFVWWLSGTLLGLRLRAFGENPRLAEQLNLSPFCYTAVALMFANALVGVAGALFAQRIFVADVNSGIGVTLASLVPVFAAGALAPTPRHIARIVLLIATFSIIYRLIFGIVLLLEVPSELFRLLTAIAMVIVFAVARGRWATFGGSIRWN